MMIIVPLPSVRWPINGSITSQTNVAFEIRYWCTLHSFSFQNVETTLIRNKENI